MVNLRSKNVDIIKLTEQVSALSEQLIAKKMMITTAESCTGGMIAEVLTRMPGSSAWFDRSFITYSNEAKQDMLDVKQNTLIQQGAVSQATVIEMAEGALAKSQSQVAIACSGIAGPGGGSPEKPVGTVWVAWAFEGEATQSKQFLFEGERQQVREQCTVEAIAETIKGLL